MGNPTDKSLRQQLIFGSVLLMLIALFTSRVLLTITTIAFLVFTILHKDFLKQFRNFFSSRFLLGMALLFFIPFISGLWSEDSAGWLRSVRIKLPLFLFPIAFAGNWQLTSRQWKYIGYVFIILVALGSSWSLYQYFSNFEEINKSYLRAKAIPTPLDNDHIRFSLLVCVAIIASILLMLKEQSKKTSYILVVASIFFAVYLHVLSARTGLAGFYIILLVGLACLVLKYRNHKFSWILVATVVCMPLFAWFVLPTFQNRIRYMVYDLSHANADQYLVGSNDGSRLVSLKAGWNILKNHPLGVGSGDVVNETMKWYEANVPEMLPTGLYPSSEWLMYGGSAGWPGIILFSLVMLMPFFERKNERVFWIALNAVMAFSLLFDIGLEVQFGVFIYAFVVLWWWKWLERGKLTVEKGSR